MPYGGSTFRNKTNRMQQVLPCGDQIKSNRPCEQAKKIRMRWYGGGLVILLSFKFIFPNKNNTSIRNYIQVYEIRIIQVYEIIAYKKILSYIIISSEERCTQLPFLVYFIYIIQLLFNKNLYMLKVAEIVADSQTRKGLEISIHIM